MRNLYDEGKSSFLKDKEKLKKQLRNCFILLITLTATHITSAQLVVTQNTNAQSLALSLAGTGVTITNCTKTANANSTGTFTNSATNLGLSSGVLLTTGSVLNVSQAANTFASSSYTGNGDAQLQTLTGGYVYDKTVLEFDVIPEGNILMFNYVFASEEYPEWVCSQFNDVFGFFISGPNPGGGNYSSQNIARVPGTNLPVAINTINRGLTGSYGNPVNCQSLSYSSLHINNLTPTINPGIIYDGMTIVLTASASVIPCQTYHLKLAVADVSDRIYDSGVFLQANSVVSVPVSITSTADLDYAGYNSTYEGCVGGKFTFSIPTPQPTDVLVNIQVSGTAINGVDYPSIPSTVTIPAGLLSKDIIVMPVQDGVTEADEDIVITTTNPCTGQPLASAMMVVKDDVAATIAANQTVLCNGQSSQMVAVGGLNYTWSPATGLSSAGIYNPVATPATTTTYTVTMDWGACTKTATKTITVGGSPLSLSASPAIMTCDGSPVQLTANGSGTFAWSNGAISPSVNITSSGNYTVTSTDISGCTTTASASVTISNLNIASPIVSPSCGGASNGGVDITINGTGTPYQFNWSNAVTTEDLLNVAAGNYTVTVSNTDGCSVTNSYTVAQAASSMNLLASVNDVSCNGGNNGSIQLNVNGGNSPYTFVWNTGSSNQNLLNLNAGTYDVIVTDASGCMKSQSFVVAENNGIQLTASKVDVTCYGGNDGSISLNVSGGNSVYSFVWNDGNNNQNRTSLSAGNYSVTVTDGNGCFVVNNTSISQASAISIALNVNGTDCSSSTGAASATVTNGLSPLNYNWSHNSNIHIAAVNGLAPGSITVSVTDANGCSASQSSTISVAANNTDADFTYSGNYCESNATVNFSHNGSSNITSHYWSFGTNNISSAANPSYSFQAVGVYNVIHIVSANYCSDTVIKTINIYPNPVVTAAVNNLSCGQTNNGSIALNVTGGSTPFQYNWSDGANSANRTNLSAASYSVVVSDLNSCSASFSAVLTQTAGLNISASHVNPTCYGSANGSINLNVNGGTSPFTFNWSNGAVSEDLGNLIGGSYTVTAQDANNCSATKMVFITEPSEIVVNYTKSDVVCNGQNNGSINVNVSGGTGAYIYHWSNNAATQIVTTLPAGYYALTVTDANNCSSVSNYTIDEPVALSANVIKNEPLCHGVNDGSIQLDVAGGTQPYSFNWNNGATAQNLNNLASGSYIVSITDNSGCSTQVSAVLAQPSAIIIHETHASIGCEANTKGSVTVNVSGGLPSYLYHWSNGASTSAVSTLPIGYYAVTITDANGCSAQLGNIEIAPNPPITVTIQVTDVACAGVNNGKVNVSVTGGNAPYLFHWNNGSTAPSIVNLAAGTYMVSVLDAKGCSANASATVNAGDALQLNAAVTQPTCNAPKGAINLDVINGSAPYSFVWNNGSAGEDLQNLSAGIYTVSIRDANNCPLDTMFEIQSITTPSITVTGGGEINLGETAQLSVSSSSGNLTYSWLPIGVSCATCTDVTVAPAQTTEYTVVATDSNGCTAQEIVTVQVSSENNIFLPNAFSPNGDGNNDVLQLYGNLSSIKYFQLMVFDRWGEKVFDTNNQHFTWDGTYRGQRNDGAVYIYVMKVVYLNGKSDRTFKGSINIL